MFSTARENYLNTDVRTATPQRLQLMLIEAALRSAERGRQQWQEKQDDWAIGSIVHAQNVMGELLAGIDRTTAGELGERVSAVYEFILRSLIEAGHHHNEKSLADAIRLLELERETWRQVCEKITTESHPERAAGSLPAAPHFFASDDFNTQDVGGFSIDA
ncbi:MAG: flagellar export chaperone FliS [Planctomycetota bacterium]